MARKIRRQVSSGWVDETLPPRAQRLIRDIGGDTHLEAQIGALLGRYRIDAAYRDTQPTLDESKQHLQKTIRALDELIGYLEMMPGYCEAFIATKQLQTGGNHRLKADVETFRFACQSVLTDLQWTPSRRGERAKMLEHKLLSRVDDLLAAYVSGKEKRAGKASEILRAAGIRQMPVDCKKARAAILSCRQ